MAGASDHGGDDEEDLDELTPRAVEQFHNAELRHKTLRHGLSLLALLIALAIVGYFLEPMWGHSTGLSVHIVVSLGISVTIALGGVAALITAIRNGRARKRLARRCRELEAAESAAKDETQESKDRAERAEERAERAEARADRAEERMENLRAQLECLQNRESAES